MPGKRMPFVLSRKRQKDLVKVRRKNIALDQMIIN